MKRKDHRQPGQFNLFDWGESQRKHKRPDDYFNLSRARAARDEGMDSVSENNKEWIAAAILILHHLPKGWRGLPEEYCEMIVQQLGDPTDFHAWGALARMVRERGLFGKTGRRLQMAKESSHARETDEYERL